MTANNSLLIYHHLGLGDHIICHGIVREYCQKYEYVDLFCKKHNLHSVQDMYRDIDKLNLIPADDDYANEWIQNHGDSYSRVLKVGFNLNQTYCFEQQFYNMASVNFSKKWDNFHIPFEYEGYKIQAEFSKSIDYKNYIFIHDDRRYFISPGIIRMCAEQDIPHFYTSDIKVDSIIKYIQTIKRASQIHVIDSAFLFLIDCLDYDYSHQQLFIHRYARSNPAWCLPILKKDWTILQ